MPHSSKQSIFKIYTDQLHYKEALATVYCGLSDEECLRVASRHNINGHFHHEMTYSDYVSEHTENMGEKDTKNVHIHHIYRWMLAEHCL